MLSVTVTSIVNESASVGVPLKRPELLSVSPAGPPVAAKLYPVPEPPDGVSCWPKLSPTVNTGSVVGLIVIAGSTVIEYDKSPVALMLSVTVTSIVNESASVGVPLNSPVLLSVRPAGTPVAAKL